MFNPSFFKNAYVFFCKDWQPPRMNQPSPPKKMPKSPRHVKIFSWILPVTWVNCNGKVIGSPKRGVGGLEAQIQPIQLLGSFLVGCFFWGGWKKNNGWWNCCWYVRVVLNSFIWKTPSSPKKKFFRRTFANSMFIFRGTCWPRFLRKTWMCDIMISSNCSRRLIPCHTSFCGRCT